MEDHSDLLDALSAIDPSTLNYQEWLNVGMALHESGLPLDRGTNGVAGTREGTTRASASANGAASARGRPG